MTGLGFRIKTTRSVLNLTQTLYGRLLRITQGTVSDWEREITHPSRGDLRLVADLFHDSEKVFHWLETGKDNPGLRPKHRY